MMAMMLSVKIKRREEIADAIRQHRQREAQEAVAAHLQEHAGEDHRAGGRRLDMGVRQPGVDRPHRHLDREAREEGKPQPELQSGVEPISIRVG